jgi:prepilin-type N-terminal cleavage/methylation domain-containing protein
MSYLWSRSEYRRSGCIRVRVTEMGLWKTFQSPKTRGRFVRIVFSGEFGVDGKLTMRKTEKRQQGFSLIESMVAVGIMLSIMAFAMVQSLGSVENYRVNSAMDIILSQLRVARQIAIGQRRNVTITFNSSTSPNSITYAVVADTGDTYTPAPVTVKLPPQVNIAQVSGVPDTPMAFGTCSGASGICIANVSGGPSTMQFTSVGQFTDSTGVNTLNGTVFLSLPGIATTSRAVTIMGSTGRVREYSYTGTVKGWQE